MDRRKHKRFDLDLAIRLLIPALSSDAACTMLNVSRSGVAFLCEKELARGESVEYELSYPSGHNPELRVVVRCKGTVVRVDRLQSAPLGVRIVATIERYEMWREPVGSAAAATGN